MRFAQLIDFQTNRIDEFTAAFDAVVAEMAGRATPHRAILHKDRASESRYQLRVEFASHDLAVQNSGRPEVAEFAALLIALCDQPPTSRDLDILCELDIR